MSQPITTSTQSDSHSADLRARIVGILSDTANGCLSELGYYPGLLKRLQELERLNAQWKDENVKLFQDNRALAQFSRRHGERLKEATATPPDNSAKIALLEEQLKALSIQNTELRKKNEALSNPSTQCNNPAHLQLIKEHQHLVSMYRVAMSEIQQLRQMVESNVATADHYRFYNQPRQAGPMPSPDLRLSYEPQAPAVQSLAQRYAPTQIPYSPTIPTGFHPSITVPQNPLQPPWPSTQYMQQRRANCDVAQPTMPSSQPPQKIITPMPNFSGTIPLQMSPISPSTPRTHEPYHMMPPAMPVAQPVSVQYHRRTPLTIQISPSSTPNTSSRPPQSSLQDNAQHSPYGPNTVVVSHPSPMPEKRPVSRPTSTSGPLSQSTSSQLSPVTRDISPPRAPPVGSMPYKSLSPPDSVSVATPISGVMDTSVEVVSSPVMMAEQMKRTREITSDSSDAGSDRKKARVDEENQVAEIIQDSRTDDDGSEQEVIEIDSDGFRSITSCLTELMENSPNSPEWQMCRLCDVRYKNGLISEPPKPFLGASQEQLVHHLAAEHSEAWETLRRDV